MRQRNSSRLLVLDKNNRVLLFRFKQKHKASLCHSFWATPGGEIEVGETAQQTAKRELYEETGISVDIASLEEPIWHHQFVFRTYHDEVVNAHESFFVIRIADSHQFSCANWTQLECEMILEYKWWSIEQLQSKPVEGVGYPENLIELLKPFVGEGLHMF